ncbi:MAG: proline--tRNA ligase [Planctomycetota bacterium]
MAAGKSGITPRSEDYPSWYNDVIKQAGLSENSPVRGCMVIKPYGYAIWERLQSVLDGMIKATGHQNAYFPLFIPMSFLTKEAEHVEGFAKECAIVTHHRLKAGGEGEDAVVVDPSAKLEEPLIVRPTSETIMYSVFADWIESWRDLPLLINQWANVVRWEMRTRPFLRTAEFLWQEGHTAHETQEEAEAEVRKMLDVYATLAEDYLAMPVLKGRKTESERFAGALHTYCIEALMQDGKALQAGTSHNLGQNFAKAFNVTFTGREGKLEHAWQTSWGVSTRLIGALIMTHSDDNGLVLPPKLAPIEVVVVPIYKSDEDRLLVLGASEELQKALDGRVRLHIDDRDQYRPGHKFFEWEKKGVPIRIEVGPRDVKENKVILARRDTGEKNPVSRDGLAEHIVSLLGEIQTSLFERAKTYREDNTRRAESFDEFRSILEEHRGFVRAYFSLDTVLEEKIKNETKATVRCLPLDGEVPDGAKCIFSGEPAKADAVFAIAY